MGIHIYLGNVGSGKTVHAVRDIYKDGSGRKTYTNIKTKMKHQINIDPSMIIKREVVDHKQKRDGSMQEVVKNKLNLEFWRSIKEEINVTLDEAHSILNARKSMSSTNIILTDWIALIRRVLGTSDGNLTLITQIPRRIDSICREMATKIIYHKCHYKKLCKKCGVTWLEHSEMPESHYKCPLCGSYTLKKYDFKIEAWKFQSMEHFNAWREFAQKSYYDHFMINDIEKYFPLYDTLQWDNLFSEYY